jgi:formylglycine-generating enzyme required for sulfatase activity
MPHAFITVPETTLPNGTVVPKFQVGQYACSRDTDGQLAITASGTPWVRINYHEARAACEAAGFRLITELQWLAIAHNAAQQDCNWTKGEVGKGKLFRGIRKGLVSSAQPGSYEPEDAKERRWLTLSNGERICDMNGNVYSWVFDDVQGDENGVVAKAFADDSPSITAPFPSIKKGMGWRPGSGANWSGNALLRGGYWYSESYAGVFCLNNDGPGFEYDYVGFRCTK